jgi:hypothetical protein
MEDSVAQSSVPCYIKYLPTVLFSIVQSYLVEYEYRRLMNTNVSIFRFVKYETVYYSFTAAVLDVAREKESCEFLVEFFNRNVKNKLKQIQFCFRVVDSADLLSCIDLFGGTSSLHFDGTVCCNFNEFPLWYFSNITHLKLCTVEGVGTIPARLKNIENLELIDLPNLVDVSALARIPTLQRLSIISCPGVSDVSMLGSIPHLQLGQNEVLTDCTPLQNHRSLCVVSGPLAYGDLSFGVFSSIEKLILQIDFACINDNHFESMRNIPHIHLANTDEMMKPVVPVSLNGKYIKLSGFDLSEWENQEFPNLEVLNLQFCSLPNFPVTPNLSELYLSFVEHFRFLPFNPKLKKALFHQLSGFDGDLTNLSHLEKLFLSDLRTIQDISLLKDIKKLKLLNCETFEGSFTSSTEFNSSQDLVVTDAHKCLDYSPFKNVYRLLLLRSNIMNCKDICNVKVLIIWDCPEFVDTSALNNVRVLKIFDCLNLVELKNLKNIPNIQIQGCPALEDYSGLGDNDRVIIDATPVLDKLYQEYRTDQSHSEIFANIKELRITPPGTYHSSISIIVNSIEKSLTSFEF